MGIRIVFSLVVTLGLLVGAMLWHGADTPPALEAGAERAEEALGRATEVAEDVARDVADEVAAVKREAEPVVRRVAAMAAARAAASREEAAAARPAPEEEAPVEEVPEPAATPPEEIARAEEAPETPETIEETVIDPYEAHPFLEGPAEASDDGAIVVLEERPDDSDAAPAGVPDQDAWAGLIRRMLAVYERVETPR